MTVASPKKMPRKKEDPIGQERRKHALVVKGRPAWKEWLARGAEHCDLDISICAEEALERYFRSKGFKEKMPWR